MTLRFLAISASLALLAACPRAPRPAEPQPTPAPPLRIPPGCEADLSGLWQHTKDPSYRYLADDDGGTVHLAVARLPLVDAGFVPRKFRAADAGSVDAGSADAGSALEPEPDAGDAAPEPQLTVIVTRSPEGFSGFTFAALRHPSGRTCEARFATRIVSCSDGGLLLEAEGTTALSDTCEPPAHPQDVPLVQHALTRVPDAG